MSFCARSSLAKSHCFSRKSFAVQKFRSSTKDQTGNFLRNCLRKGKPLTKQLGFSNYTTPGDMANHLRARPSQMLCLGRGVSSWLPRPPEWYPKAERRRWRNSITHHPSHGRSTQQVGQGLANEAVQRFNKSPGISLKQISFQMKKSQCLEVQPVKI